VVILFKALSLFWFESALLFLLPCLFTISIILIFFGIKNILKYAKELFFAIFLFFPTEQFESVIEDLTQITVIIAKSASYLLYYVGFNVVSQGNQVILSLPNLGEFKAIVNYPCAGLPMVLLNLKLALLLISLFSMKKIHRILAPLISVGIGLILGTIRVCIMTLAIPNPTRFDYWHGSEGSQIFSTIGMALVFAYWYWVMQQQETSNNTYSDVANFKYESEK
jgi:cyanoexosortase A